MPELLRIEFDRDETGLVVPFPSVDDAVGDLRRRHDPAAVRYGIPPHVTVLFPFLPFSEIDDGVIDALTQVAARHSSFDVRFPRTGRFPEVLYLVPEPAEPFVDLTRAVTSRWPDHPPYEGRFGEIVPHLTIGHGPAGDLDATARETAPRLPIRARAASLDLLRFDGDRWVESRSFPLG